MVKVFGLLLCICCGIWALQIIVLLFGALGIVGGLFEVILTILGMWKLVEICLSKD